MSTERESTGGGVVLVDPLGGLVLDPSNELRFKGPFDDYVTVSLTIRNPTEKRIAFKIKTTAPKRYCVKPNSGVLDPGQLMKVNVLLQPFNYDPNEKNKHKFMVQYLYLNDEEIQLSVNEILNMWKDVSASRLLDLKLKCLFEFTEAEQQKLSQQHQQQQQQNEQQNQTLVNSSNLASVTANNTNILEQTTIKQKQTNQQQQPPVTKNTNKLSNAADVYSTATESQSSSDFDSTSNVVNSSNISKINNNIPSTIAANVSATRQDKNDNLLNELKLTKEENDTLKKEIARLKDEEQRLRKLALSSSSSSSGHHNSTTEFSSFSDLLNNRLVLIIVLLIAMIVYLLLFR
jgi:hypothetical protein